MNVNQHTLMATPPEWIHVHKKSYLNNNKNIQSKPKEEKANQGGFIKQVYQTSQAYFS